MNLGAWLWYPLENPWPFAILAIALGLIARQAFSARRRLAGMRASWLLGLGLAVSIVLAARGVTTPREELIQRTRALVFAAGGAAGDEAGPVGVDLATIKATVDDEAMIVGPDGQPLALFRLMVRRLDDVIDRHGVTGQAIRTIDAEADRGQGVSVVRVSTRSEGGLPPINSAWRLIWRRDIATGQWLVEELRLLEVNNQSPTPGMLP
ncbi:MAG: hypothetical protein AAFY08_12360 [Planctomycetota bacterium]